MTIKSITRDMNGNRLGEETLEVGTRLLQIGESTLPIEITPEDHVVIHFGGFMGNAKDLHIIGLSAESVGRMIKSGDRIKSLKVAPRDGEDALAIMENINGHAQELTVRKEGPSLRERGR